MQRFHAGTSYFKTLICWKVKTLSQTCLLVMSHVQNPKEAPPPIGCLANFIWGRSTTCDSRVRLHVLCNYIFQPQGAPIPKITQEQLLYNSFWKQKEAKMREGWGANKKTWVVNLTMGRTQTSASRHIVNYSRAKHTGGVHNHRKEMFFSHCFVGEELFCHLHKKGEGNIFKFRVTNDAPWTCDKH